MKKTIGKEELKQMILATLNESSMYGTVSSDLEKAGKEIEKIKVLKNNIDRIFKQEESVPFTGKTRRKTLRKVVSDIQDLLKSQLYQMDESSESISEVDVEGTEFEKQMSEFYELFRKFQEAKSEFEKIQDEFKASEEIMRTALESIDESEERMFKLKDIIVRIKKKGFERTDYKYKEASEELYRRVNPAIKALITELMENSKKITYIKSSIEVKTSEEELNEVALFRKAKEIFTNLISTLAKKLKLKNQDLDDSIDFLEDLAY